MLDGDEKICSCNVRKKLSSVFTFIRTSLHFSKNSKQSHNVSEHIECSYIILKVRRPQSILVCFPITLLVSVESDGCFPAKMSMIRFASWANNCRGSTFELNISLALLTTVAASEDIARLRRSSNSSSETSPICNE